jgi:hypothetical protein
MRVRPLLGAPVALVACVLNPAFDPAETDATDSAASTTMTTTASTTTTGDAGEPLGDVCPPLPAPAGDVIAVGPGDGAALPGIVANAPQGATIVLEPGTYAVTEALLVNAPGITIRSSTGDPTDVVLDGQGTLSVVFPVRQPDVTIAEITIDRAADHAIHVSGSPEVAAARFTGYRLLLHDNGSTAIKANPGVGGMPADDGTVACSTIEIRDEARPALGAICDYRAVTGSAAFGWHLRDNSIRGMWCQSGIPGPAILFGESSAHTVIERNVLRDCWFSIQLGIHDEQEPARDFGGDVCGGGYFGHYGGVVANNMIVATGTGIAASEFGLDAGIGLWQVCDATLVHNTVVSAIDAFSSIEYRFDRTQAIVLNNLVTDDILDRDGAGVPVGGNLQNVDLNNFVDPLGGDVHLADTSAAIDAGVQLGEQMVLHDIDGDPRDASPDIGADELL